MEQDYNPEGYQLQQLWCLGLSAILTEFNGQRHDVLLHQDPERFCRTLSSWWDITDRPSYLENIEWLTRQGQREVFIQLYRDQFLTPDHVWRSQAASLQKAEPKQYQREMLVRHYSPVLGACGIAAWDIGRTTSLARMAATCGYISKQEAWATLIEQANIVKRAFKNWFEYGHSYLIGRQFAMGNLDDEMGKRTLEITQQLLSDELSPWMRHPEFTDGVVKPVALA